MTYLYCLLVVCYNVTINKGVVMTKTATVSMRIDTKTKEETEQVLESIGLNMSTAFNMFCKQVVIHQGIPFSIMRARGGVADISDFGKGDLKKTLDESYRSTLDGRVKSVDDAFVDIRHAVGL